MKASNSILFIAAHPYLEKSRANHAIVEAVRDLPGLTLHLLYDQYPHFHINVAHEQSLLKRHQLIVIQHPFYWYSVPPLLKMWLDEILESGWAYGPHGDQLKGKDMLVSMTVGGPAESYAAGSYNRFPMETFLAPWDQTARLCQMNWQPPQIFYGSIEASPDEIKKYASDLRFRLEQYVLLGEWS